MKKFVTYLRVSTQKQGESGLGLEAQRKMCADFIERHSGQLDKEFVDVESGTHRNRKGLWQAIEYCKANRLPLVIAKLDRLARDVEFTFRVINTGIEIHFTDMPVVNSMILGVFASVAQYEREMCSTRTKAALQAKKQKGYLLGGRNEKFRDAMTGSKLKARGKAIGLTKSKRNTESRSVLVFCNILRKVFPDACKHEQQSQWDWSQINTRGTNKKKVLALMKSYNELEPTLFPTWDFSAGAKQLQVRLASHINNCKKSFFNAQTQPVLC